MSTTASSHLKALIAEDEPAMLGLLSRQLKGMGFSVVEAGGGDKAWALAQEHHPDLILLDVMMPGMSGWEVCKRIKAHVKEGPFHATGVIMLTGIGENLNDMTSPLFAADTWLNKPFDFAELQARIHETLAKYGKSLSAPVESVPAKKAPAKKTAPKKTAAKKTAPKKTVAKKAPAKKSAPKKTVAKKTAKKSAPKKTVAKKAPAKKSAKKTARSK